MSTVLSVHDLTAPLWVPQTQSKKFYCNLNTYRNAHFQTLNKVKIRFKDAMEDQIKGLPVLERITITYTLFPKTKRLCDVSNVCAIVDKFFCDALVEHGKLADDNYLYLSSVQYRFGKVDKDNPRVDIKILNSSVSEAMSAA